jgi:probable rRNA maturation factor
MKIEINNQSGRAVPRDFLEDWCHRMSRELKLRKKDLVIAFLNEKEMRALNKKFRGKNYATDVLSFESDDPAVYGELVICPQVISRQAKEHGLLVREELGYMVLHGVLHLLGYDHERSEREAKKMFALQDKVFEHLCGSLQTAKS